LEEWRHYLLGTAHIVTVLTDHKNLTYFRQLHKLSRRQARWNLFLQDFDLRFHHTPGTQMGPADTLSRRDNVDTADDNVELMLLPDDLFVERNSSYARMVDSSHATCTLYKANSSAEFEYTS
jgi:hypothetical protein